jgi:hypothetical protein
MDRHLTNSGTEGFICIIKYAGKLTDFYEMSESSSSNFEASKLIPRNTVPEKLTVTQFLNKSNALYGTERFITVLTKDHNWVISCVVESSSHPPNF